MRSRCPVPGDAPVGSVPRRRARGPRWVRDLLRRPVRRGYTHGVLDLWVLDGHEPVPATDPRAWAESMEEARRSEAFRVGGDVVDGWLVSTIFLGIDHRFARSTGRPVLFETMIFDPDGAGDYQRRYRTWAEAEAGHRHAVELARRRPLHAPR